MKFQGPTMHCFKDVVGTFSTFFPRENKNCLLVHVSASETSYCLYSDNGGYGLIALCIIP